MSISTRAGGAPPWRPPALTPEEDSVDLPDDFDIDESLPADLWFRSLRSRRPTEDHRTHA